MKSLIARIFNKSKSNNDNHTSYNQYIGWDYSNGDYTDRELINLAHNNAVATFIGRASKENILKNVKYYNIRPSCYTIDNFCKELGLSDFNYKGFLLKHRYEFLTKVLLQVKISKPYSVRFLKSVNPQLINEQIQFIKEGDYIRIEKNNLKKIYIKKSEKEKVLKSQYENLKTEVDQIFNEFDLDIHDKDYLHMPVEYSVHRSGIKPNIITGLDLMCMKYMLRNMYHSYRGFYGTYLISKLDLLKKDYESEMFGRLGEEKVIEATNEFDNCIAIHNVKLPAKNYSGQTYTFEIDTILVTTRGVFILEVKNYGTMGNYELKIDSTGRWSTYYPETNNEITRENPNKQNNMHVMNFNKFINESLPQFNNNIDASGIIVIGNDDVKIIQENPSKNLKRVDELYNYIKEFPNNVYSMEQVNEIAKCIKENNVKTEKKYPIDSHYEEVLNNIDFIREDLNLLQNALYQDSKPHSAFGDECYLETLASYLTEQESKYNYKFVFGRRVMFSRFYRDKYGVDNDNNNRMYIYPLDIIKDESIAKLNR